MNFNGYDSELSMSLDSDSLIGILSTEVQVDCMSVV